MPTPIQVLSDLNPQDQVLDQIYFADDDNRIKSDQSWDFDPQDTDFHDNSDNGSERVKKFDNDFKYDEYDFYDGHDMSYQDTVSDYPFYTALENRPDVWTPNLDQPSTESNKL